MPVISDLHGRVWVGPVYGYNSGIVSTAIARIYTPEGFVIASDGRKTRSDTNAILSESEQKIFPIDEATRQLAYALSGAVQLTHSDTDEVLFDYIVEASAAVAGIKAKQPRSLYHYAEALGDKIAQSAGRIVTRSGEIDASVEGSDVHVSIDGYYDGRPKRASVRFINHTSRAPDVEVSTDELFPGHLLGFGSPELFSLVPSGDSRFAKYRVIPKDPERVTLSEAVLMARKMIEAHMDPEAEKLFPANFACTGGKIQVAAITFQDGFHWVDYANNFAKSQA